MIVELSIIIVTYNSDSVILDCIKSIADFNDLADKLEVIIVDNSPTDRLKSTLVDFPSVLYIHNPKNGGFGQGNNIGVRSSSGEICLFLNPDTILVEPIFNFVVSKFKEFKNLSACGFKLVNIDCKMGKSFGFFPEKNSLIPERINNFIYNFFFHYFNFCPKNIFPWGADLTVRRSRFIEIGMFDEDYFLSYEEPDLLKRMNRMDEVRIFSKKIIHIGGHSTIPREIMLATLRSQSRYFIKYKLNYKPYLVQKIRWLKFIIFIKKHLRRPFKAEMTRYLYYLEVQSTLEDK